MLKEAQVAFLLLIFGITVFAVQGQIKRSNERASDLLYLYAQRVYAASWDYSASASSQLRDGGARVLPVAVLEASRHGVGLSTWAPNGQNIRLYSFGDGTKATLYAVIPGGGSWLGLGGSIFVNTANRMGVRAGTVEGAIIVSRAGGWRVALASLPGLVANDGDLIVRLTTLVEQP